jgi:hypothetical protein
MFLSLVRRLFATKTVATAERIRGNLSQGRKDTPGVWYKV